MSRFSVCPLIAFCALWVSAAAAEADSSPLPPSPPVKEKMNVLFIIVDDLRPDLACYGLDSVKSPNIDKLASQGVLFRNAYCQQAVCAPSRISVLSGLRPDSTGVFDLDHPLRKVLPDVLSLPQYFRNNGYETSSLGKVYHHLHDDDGQGWTSPAWRPEGAWKGRGYLASELQAADAAGKSSKIGPAWECADVADELYPDGQIELKAEAELRRFKAEGKPFFLAVGFNKPHLPFCAPKRYWDLYDEAALSLPEQATWPAGMPPLAGTTWSELRQYTGINKKGELTQETARKLIHGYHACVSYTDALIGKLLAELDRQGLRDNTVIVLFGDHGWKLGEYGAWTKHTNFELDTQAPLIFAAPGLAGKGQKSPALAEFVDIYPTLAELSGLPVPAHCEGVSLVPVLQNPLLPWKQAAFSQYPRGKLMGYTLRCGQWRYTEWIDPASQTVAARELYDHQKGPVASKNLAEEPDCAETVKRLSALLQGGKGWKAVQQNITARPRSDAENSQKTPVKHEDAR
ncbi:MAG: hypothetical protein RL095_156 [Verrucomicrobiota bacterium]|jgi:iduronate 2-sulfatase